MTSTTIKVPRDLRDRLATVARVERTTLAGAIASALDARDEREFWVSVHREHSALTDEERARYLRSGGTDDLADDADDLITERDEW